jgi:hypothetical protein
MKYTLMDFFEVIFSDAASEIVALFLVYLVSYFVFCLALIQKPYPNVISLTKNNHQCLAKRFSILHQYSFFLLLLPCFLFICLFYIFRQSLCLYFRLAPHLWSPYLSLSSVRNALIVPPQLDLFHCIKCFVIVLRNLPFYCYLIRNLNSIFNQEW